MLDLPPPLLLVTDHASAARGGHALVDAVEAALAAGVPAVLFRDRELSTTRRYALGEELATRTRAAGASLLVAGDARLATHLDADALHLAARDPWPHPTAWDRPLGRSTHDAEELRDARERGAAYATLSPVAPTVSKPGYGPPLGEAGLRTLVQVAGPLPVLALGGVVAGDVARWRATGVAGLAVMGGILAAADPGDAVRELLAAWWAADPSEAPTADPAEAVPADLPDDPPTDRPRRTP